MNKDAEGIKTLFSRVSLPLVYSSRQIRELFFSLSKGALASGTCIGEEIVV